MNFYELSWKTFQWDNPTEPTGYYALLSSAAT